MAATSRMASPPPGARSACASIPSSRSASPIRPPGSCTRVCARPLPGAPIPLSPTPAIRITDRKSTRLNSSHVRISYAVFCLKKKTKDSDVRAYAPLTHLPPAPLGQRFHDVLLHQPPAQLLRCVHYN